jgi:tetratricopeptide (TPR) repeat protein
VAPPSPQGSPSYAARESTADRTDDTSRLEKIEGLIREGKYHDAIPLLQAYLRDFPKSPRAYYDLGYVTFRTHDFRTSITNLSKSLALNVNNPEAHKILGLNCSLIGRYDLAERELREAIREKPDSAEIHYFLGRLFYTRGVYPLAKKEFDETLRLDPNYMKAWDNLGLTMEVLGDDNKALECYATAMNLNEELKLHSEWPYVNVSALYNRQHQPDQALEYARKAITFNPRSDRAYLQLAKAYRTLGDWQQCAESAQKAIDLNPQTADVYYVLSIALRKLGRTEESRAAAGKFEEILKEELIELPQKLGGASGRGMVGHSAQNPRDEEP